MTARTWIGGGNNEANNAKDWSPEGVPQLGDTLAVSYLSGIDPQPFVMNVKGSALAGDPVSIGVADSAGVNLTANLSHKADMTAILKGDSDGTFNLSQHSILDLSLVSGALVGVDSATVNVSGHDTMVLDDDDSIVTVSLISNSKLTGTFDMGPFHGETFGRLTINGDAGSAFKNDGNSVIDNTERATINTDVTGKGSFEVSNTSGFIVTSGGFATLEFGASVGPKQFISDSGLVVIDQPNEFSAKITLTTTQASPAYPLPAEIDLHGLATADSYTFRNDMLSIFSGKSVIDRLHLTDDTAHGFAVEKAAGSVNIVAISDPTNPPIGLPIHIG